MVRVCVGDEKNWWKLLNLANPKFNGQIYAPGLDFGNKQRIKFRPNKFYLIIFTQRPKINTTKSFFTKAVPTPTRATEEYFS
jgi:hypothetical protein